MLQHCVESDCADVCYGCKNGNYMQQTGDEAVQSVPSHRVKIMFSDAGRRRNREAVSISGVQVLMDEIVGTQTTDGCDWTENMQRGSSIGHEWGDV